MSSPFHLSHLPLLPLNEISKHLNFMELFNLSQCSKKTSERIKSVSTRKAKLALYFGRWTHHVTYENDEEEFGFYFESSDSIRQERIYDFRTFNFGKKKVKVPVQSRSTDSLNSFWDDNLTAMKLFVFHLMDIFKCPIENFESKVDLCDKNIRSFLGEIMTKQAEIKKLKTLDIDMRPICDKYSLDGIPKIINILKSSWITIENLFSFRLCQKIVLEDTNFTNQDIDVFVKSWKNGNFSNLEVFDVCSKKLNVDEKIADIYVGRLNRDGERLKCKKIDGDVWRLRFGWDIQKNDGVLATISLEDNHLRMFVWL